MMLLRFLPILGMCSVCSGCICLGAYPYVQDVRGPVRGVQVCDVGTGKPIPDARVTFQSCSGGPRNEPEFYPLTAEGVGLSYGVWDREKHIQRSLTDGALERRDDGLFEVPWSWKPGIGLVGLTFTDGTHYFGPFGDNRLAYTSYVTAWAPGYGPMQVEYFSEGKGNRGWAQWHGDARCEFHPDGVCRILLARQPSQTSAPGS
jgi:hypothetical protein